MKEERNRVVNGASQHRDLPFELIVWVTHFDNSVYQWQSWVSQKISSRLFLKQAKERVKEVADWVSWANGSVAYSSSTGLWATKRIQAFSCRLRKVKWVKASEKLWLLPSRFILWIDSVSATLVTLVQSVINDAYVSCPESVPKVTIVLFMALLISFEESSKQPQPDHRLLTS